MWADCNLMSQMKPSHLVWLPAQAREQSLFKGIKCRWAVEVFAKDSCWLWRYACSRVPRLSASLQSTDRVVSLEMESAHTNQRPTFTEPL